MQVHKAVLNSDTLKSASPEEKELFIALAHAVNEVNAFNKLLLWAANGPSDGEPQSEGRISMIMMLLIQLAGKLKEGHELIRQKYYGTRLSEQYGPAIQEEGSAALRKLNRTFDGSNLLAKLRNTYAFHYSQADLTSILEKTDEELKIYMQEGGNANNLYYFAEMLFGSAILEELGIDDGLQAFRKLSKEITGVASQFTIAADHLLYEFLNRRGNQAWDREVETIELENLPSLVEITLQWFTDTSGI